MTSPLDAVVARLPERFRTEQAQKFLRYSLVAAVFLPVGQILLNVSVQLFDWPAVASNLAVATLCTPANYWANKRFVWRHDQRDRLAYEVLVFWVCAVLGVIFSTLAIYVAVQLVDVDEHPVLGAIAFLASAFVGFGLVWIAKFLVLDRYLFRDPPEPPVDGASTSAAGASRLDSPP